MQELVVFKFPEDGHVEDDLALAIFSAECMYGRPQTRLEVGYHVAGDYRSCVLEASGPAGEMAVRVLIGLLGSAIRRRAVRGGALRQRGCLMTPSREQVEETATFLHAVLAPRTEAEVYPSPRRRTGPTTSTTWRRWRHTC